MKCQFSNTLKLRKSEIEQLETVAGRSLYTDNGVIQVRNQIYKTMSEKFHNAVRAIGKVVCDIWKKVLKAISTLVKRGERVVKAEKSLVLRTKRFQQIRKMSPRHSQVIDRRPFRIVARSTC